jgi:outer membrane protein TolC
MALEESRLSLQRAARRAGGAATAVLADDLSAGVSAERDDGTWEVGPAFSVPIPIFDTGAAGRAGAEAQMRRDRELYAGQAIAVRNAARLAAVRLEAAAAEESHWRAVLLPLADRGLSETLLEYNAMQAGAPELLDMRARLATARASHADSLARFWRAALRVDALLAGASDAPAEPARTSFSNMDAPSGGH